MRALPTGETALAMDGSVVGILCVQDADCAGRFVSKGFAAGDLARRVVATGSCSVGISAAGTFAMGVFAARICSTGVTSMGVIAPRATGRRFPARGGADPLAPPAVRQAHLVARRVGIHSGHSLA